MNHWYLFSQNNWHNGGNSTEQYARNIESCVFVHRSKNKRSEIHESIRIVPAVDKYVLSMLKQKDSNKIAMFCYPDQIRLYYMKIAKELGIKSIYRCVDDWYVWQPNKYNEVVEKQMIELADIAVASSKKMSAKFKIKYLPNACNVNNNKKSNRGNGKVIVGFVGLVDIGRFDMGLIRFLAKEFPQLRFEMIGSKKNWVNLPPNLIVLPQTTWKEANTKIADFDVGIIPYKGYGIDTMQPIKSWEYLSYGIPQICKKGLDLPNHSSIHVYETYEECAKKLNYLVNVKIETKELIKFASKNTWRSRIDQLIEWI